MKSNFKFPITSIRIFHYQVPCDKPESDGTAEWEKTDMILLILEAEKKRGLGFTYGHPCLYQMIKESFIPALKGANVWENILTINQMKIAVRNAGLPGIASHAISAIDIALWDLKAKILEIPLCQLWGLAQKKIEAYGSGGFTSYTEEETASQFKKWQEKGIAQFKMKVGREEKKDVERVKQARKAIGNEAKLFVDANGAFQRKQALEFAEKIKEFGVTWFEEPVSSDDLEGLKLVRDHTKMNIAAGEYGYNLTYFERMLEAQAVDILQIDATRCAGYTGFLEAAHLAESFHIPISSHTAPSLHLHPCLSTSNTFNMEFFHDHVRIEEIFFEGFPKLENGFLSPDLKKAGHGLELKEESAKPFLLSHEELT